MKILVIVYNHFLQDSRVERSTELLVKKGNEVSVLALYKKGLNRIEKRNGYTIYRIIPGEVDLSCFVNGSEINIKNSSANEILEFPNFFIRVYGFLRRKIKYLFRLPKRVAKRLYSKSKLYFAANYSNDHSSFIGKLLSWFYGPLEFNNRKNSYDRLVRSSIEVIKWLKPDIIHANDFNALCTASKAFEDLNIKFVYDTHELWPHRNRPNTFYPSYERDWEENFESKAMKNSLFNMTVCQSIADHLAERYKISTPAVVRNTPLRNLNTTNEDDEYNLKKALGLNEDDFLAVYIGKITFNRGVIDIVKSIPHTNKKVYFCVFGYFDATFEKYFDSYVRKLGIGHRIFKFGPVPTKEVSKWVSGCSLSLTTMNNICLSYLYALPNKLFESLQANLPVVGPSSPEIKRIVDEYKCGMTYTDKNYVELAKVINYLYENPEILANLKLGAINASEELVWENEVKILEKEYNKVLNV